MSEQAKTELSCGEHSKGGPWYPQRKWWQSSRLFNQDVGLPPFLEPGDPWWMNVDWLQRSLAAFAWPGYVAAPLFVPYISGSMHQPSQKISTEQCKWRVSLDVAHFSPAEISLSVKDGFLEVGGRHEERPDEHGFIARCFTRKYRLPVEVDVTKVTSTLSVDGILTVEAPVPEASVPAAINIPIKVELEVTGEQEEKHEVTGEQEEKHEVTGEQEEKHEVTGEQQEKHETEETTETDPDSSTAPEAQEVPPTEDHGEEESPPEVHSDQAHPGDAPAEPQQQEERREEEEEAREQPAEESQPPASADGEGTESLADSPEHHEVQESQESPDADAAQQSEHKEPAADEEIQVTAGSAEAAEEITQPEEPEPGKSPESEVPSQELEAPDIKQEHTE